MTLDAADFCRWSDDCRRIAEAAANGVGVAGTVVVRGPDGFREPVFSDHVVSLNGDGATGATHEPFEVWRDFPSSARVRRDEVGRVFAYCKTAGKPYDAVVWACLLALQKRFGSLVRIETDTHPTGGAAGEQLYAAASGSN